MEIKALKAYLLAKPSTSEEVPFGPKALVFKVLGKMYSGLKDVDKVICLTVDFGSRFKFTIGSNNVINPKNTGSKTQSSTTTFSATRGPCMDYSV